MATSSSKDNPTKTEAFKANLAPETKPATRSEKRAESKPAPAPTAQDLAADQYNQFQAELEQRKDNIEASRKGSPVDALNLPEAQGEVLWQTGLAVGERADDEKDNTYEQRWRDAELTIVSQAQNVMSGPGGIRPNGYQLVRDESIGVLRLMLVSEDPGAPDPKRVGGLPNADGTY